MAKMQYVSAHIFSILNLILLLGLVVVFALLYVRLGKLIEQRVAGPLKAELKQAIKESEIDSNFKAIGVAEQALKLNGDQPARRK